MQCFYNYFTSIAEQLVQQLPTITGNNFRILTPYNFNTCIFYPITVPEVRNVILSFKNKKVHKNEIKPAILCEVVDNISPILTDIFNLSYSSCNSHF